MRILLPKHDWTKGEWIHGRGEDIEKKTILGTSRDLWTYVSESSCTDAVMIRKFSAREERCEETCRREGDWGGKSAVARGRLRIWNAEKFEEIRIDFETGDGAGDKRGDGLCIVSRRARKHRSSWSSNFSRIGPGRQRGLRLWTGPRVCEQRAHHRQEKEQQRPHI